MFSNFQYGFDENLHKNFQNWPQGTMTQIRTKIRYHHFVDLVTFFGRNLEAKELSSVIFSAKIWPNGTPSNPFVARLHAPNVGLSSHLFVPNKKSIRGCDAIDPKMLRIYCVSAVGIADTTSSLRSSPLPANAGRALTALHLIYECYRILQFDSVCPCGVLWQTCGWPVEYAPLLLLITNKLASKLSQQYTHIVA